MISRAGRAGRAGSLALSVVAALGPACSSDGDTVTVAAAASLVEAFDAVAEVAEDDGVDTALSFAGSQVVVEQVRQGAPVDVVAVADPAFLDPLHEEGLLSGLPVVFASNEVVVVAGPGSPVESLDDLSAPGVRVVLGVDAVPIGTYAREGLRLAGVLEAVLPNVVAEESDVSGVVGRVALGEADAGVVYATDAEADDRLDVVARLDTSVEYAAAVVAGAGEEAQRFVELLTSAEARRVLRSLGFESPADSGESSPGAVQDTA